MVRGNSIKIIAAWAIVAVIAGITGAVVNINIENGKVKANIVYSSEDVTPKVMGDIEGVEYGRGEVKIDGETIPTVESVDATGPQVNPEDETPAQCPEGEECGRGATYPYVDTSTPQAFLNATIGGCYNIDGFFDEMCWDYAAVFTLNYAGRTFYTCGTGAAKGAFADGCWQKNAGTEFEFTLDPTRIIPGAIVGFNNGTFGHVGIATGYYNNGYVTLAGQNQGGGLCPGSTMGARVNVININLKYFAGAFIPKTYLPVPDPTPNSEPTPAPTPAPAEDVCKKRVVKKGDTLGKIMAECTGKVEWGEAMNEYARHWYSVKYANYLTVYNGWASLNRVGLFAGDVIEFRDN